MRNRRALTLLVIADIVLNVVLIVLGFALQSTLPEPLRKYAEEWGEPQLTGVQKVLLFLFFINLSVGITAWISLLNYWKYGPTLYVASWALNIVGSILAGPDVNTAAEVAISTVTTLVGGMILGLVFFSDLRERFRPQSV